MLQQTTPCPNCGELAGWREKFAVSYCQFYTAEGKPDDTSEYELILGRAEGKRKRCARCDHPITKLVKELAKANLIPKEGKTDAR